MAFQLLNTVEMKMMIIMMSRGGGGGGGTASLKVHCETTTPDFF